MAFKNITLFFHISLIVFLGLIIYRNSLDAEFILDDHILIKDNMYIRGWANILNIFKEDIAAGAWKKFGFYRPFLMLTLMFDYWLWHLNVGGYHVTTVLIHILAALSLYSFIYILFRNRLLSFATAILFIAHPIHVENVTYVTGRAYPLILLFMTLSFIFYIRYLEVKKAGYFILMVISYILALLSKEHSIIFPALLLLYHYAFMKKVDKAAFLSILFLALGFIFVASLVLWPLSGKISKISNFNEIFYRLFGFSIAITNYIRLLFMPLNLHMEYAYISESLQAGIVKAVIGAAILIFLFIYAFRKRNHNRLVFFSISWFIIAMLPMSNIFCHAADYMADRYMYLPSIGFFLILSNLILYLDRAKGVKIVSYLIIAILVSIYSYLTVKQNEYWKDPFVFYERTLEYAPYSSTSYNNLATEYAEKGNYNKAIEYYKKALEISPDFINPYINIGTIYIYQNNKEEAILWYKKALDIDSENSNANYYIALAYEGLGNLEDAYRYYRKVIEVTPYYAKGYIGIGRVYYKQQKYDLAKEYLNKARDMGCPVPDGLIEESDKK